MFNLKTLTKGAAISAVALSVMATTAMAEKVLRIQSVLPNSADEVKMLEAFGKDVADLTNGSLTLRSPARWCRCRLLATFWMPLMPAWSKVASLGRTTGAASTSAANLYSARLLPVRVLASTTSQFLSWFQFGGGKELYDRLWDEMGVNVKGFMLQPVGPEALGWFSEPIASMDDFRKYRFRAPPGMVGQAYKDIGVASVAMGGGDILPALEKGTIDAAEWCCPVPDMAFGFQKVLKHYYLARPAPGCCER